MYNPDTLQQGLSFLKGNKAVPRTWLTPVSLIVALRVKSPIYEELEPLSPRGCLKVMQVTIPPC